MRISTIQKVREALRRYYGISGPKDHSAVGPLRKLGQTLILSDPGIFRIHK